MINNSVHLDDILKYFPLSSNYYLLSITLASFAYLTNSFYTINYVFAADDVKYRCKSSCDSSYKNVQEIYKNISDDRCFQYDITSIGNENISCTTDIGFRKIVPCKEWIYENPNSFVAEFQLGCEDWKRTLVGTVHSFGYMIGLLIVGPVSDRLGRKKLVIFTGVAGGIFGLLKSFSSWYWIYIILEFLESALGDIGSPLFILTMEIVAKEKMIFYQMTTVFSFPIGCVLLAFIAWYVTYWRTFLIIIYSPAIFFIFYAFILDESPRWLLTKGKKIEAVEILTKINSMSKAIINEEKISKVECIQEDSDPTLFSLLISTFRSKLLLKRFLICIAWWITCTFTNYGMQIASVTLEGNKYVNFALTSLVEIPVAITGMFVLNKCNRKMPLIVSFILGGVICLIQPLLHEKSWLTILFFLAGKFMASFSFNIIYIFTSELFPTYTRNSMHALCSSIGRIGSIVAPQVPLLVRYWPNLPALLFGLSSLLAGLLTLLIPETANRALPNTVQEAEQVGLELNK